MSLSFLCHFFVIFLSFVCQFIVILLSFWERENGEKNVKKWLPWQTFCYLVAAPNTRNKCRNAWKASRRWRRIGQGSLPWGIRFWACLDEELSPGSGCRAGSKTGSGVKWPGGGGSGPRSGADLETPKTQLYQHASHFFGFFFICLPVFRILFCIFFCIVFAFFCISQTRSHFLGSFFAFPRLGVIFLAFLFAFPKPGVIFCIFLHFLDRVCHLHRLPDPYEKTTRKWTMLESRKRQENDKKMTRKWQKMT